MASVIPDDGVFAMTHRLVIERPCHRKCSSKFSCFLWAASDASLVGSESKQIRNEFEQLIEENDVFVLRKENQESSYIKTLSDMIGRGALIYWPALQRSTTSHIDGVRRLDKPKNQ
jgi:hypothetical protein